MDYSEFLRRLGAEPRSDDPELKAAREADPRFEAAATEARELEDRIERTLRVPVDENALAEGLLAGLPESATEQDSPSRPWPWLALAATLVLSLGVAGLLLRGGGPETVEQYVLDHYRYDGPAVLARAETQGGGGDLAAILRSLGAGVDEGLAERVEFVKYCPTLHGRGAHMVVSTERGPVTVIFMPRSRVDEPHSVRFDGMAADLLTLSVGSAAIIGPEGRTEPELASLLLASIHPLESSAADA